jgi:hypothetical protein
MSENLNEIQLMDRNRFVGSSFKVDEWEVPLPKESLKVVNKFSQKSVRESSIIRRVEPNSGREESVRET